MENPKWRRSWSRAKANGKRISEYLGIGLFVLLAVSLCFCEKSYANQPNDPRRVGILFTGIPSSLPGFKDQFRKSLAERGWVEGHNIIIEERYGEGKESRLLELAKELISVKTDVIVASSSLAARAAMAATKIIPIIAIGDPIGENLVTNRVRPEANVTGLSLNESQEMSGKRLEMLKQAVPSITRVAVLLLPQHPVHAGHLKHTRATAKVLGMIVQPVELEWERPYMENAFSKMLNPQALLMLPWAMPIAHQQEILYHAAKKRLPTVYTQRKFVTLGGFMSYGPVRTHTWRRAATFVDKLLKGASPADLPVERPLHFELVINLKTANSMGLTVRPELLIQANEVIR